MSDAVDIDPRMVCRDEWYVYLACGWHVDDYGWVHDGPPMIEHIDELCDHEHMSWIMDALAGDVSLRRDDDHWIALRSGHLPGVTARASTPHEAVWALAIKIGRIMEHAP
jgi:hypothetical protein